MTLTLQAAADAGRRASGQRLRWIRPGAAVAGCCRTGLLLAGLVGWLTGCADPGPGTAARSSPRPTTTPASSRVDELNLVTMPVPVNLESLPGVDGIVIKIYAANARRPRTQPIVSGVLEVLMYEGLVRGGAEETNRYRHQWTFPAEELPAFATATTIGTGYSFRLAWGKDAPRIDKITVVARYQPPQGPTVYSSPSYLAIPGPLPGGSTNQR